MVFNTAEIYSSKINEISGRLSGRINEISNRTGISFANVFESALKNEAAVDGAAVAALLSQSAFSGTAGGTDSNNLLGASLLEALTGTSGTASGASDSLLNYLTAGGSITNTDSLLAALSGSGASTDALTQIVSSLSKGQNTSANTSANTDKYSRYEAVIESIANEYGMHPALIKAVIKAESDFNPDCKSAVGAMGLMQLMPDTAEGLGVVNAFDPIENIDGGVRYLLGQIVRYNGDLKMALAAYNCGSGTLSQRGITNLNNPEQFAKLPAETRTYITNIQRYLSENGYSGLLDSNFFK